MCIPPRASLLLFTLGACSPGAQLECDAERACPIGASCVAGRCVDDVPEDATVATTPDSGPPIRYDSGPRPDVGACAPTETPEVTCNFADDDCDGYVDNVDVAFDGFCDCLRIGVLGDRGQNPSSSFQAWLEARGTSVVRFGLDDSALTRPMLDAFDVVVVDKLLRDYTPAEANILREYVEDGGGLMVMSGYTGQGPDRTRPNTLLSAFGLSYATGLHDGPAEDWEPHAISMGVLSVTFDGGYLIEAEESEGNTVIVEIDGGAAGLVQERGAGRVFVFGDEWIQFDSEWSTMPMIERLWSNTFSWLGPRDRCDILI
jgi:hypothetical protein